MGFRTNTKLIKIVPVNNKKLEVEFSKDRNGAFTIINIFTHKKSGYNSSLANNMTNHNPQLKNYVISVLKSLDN